MINPCSLCDAKCCKTYTITVTIFDVLRICKNNGKKAEEFVFLNPLKILSYDPDMVIDTIDQEGSYLLAIKSHPCIFLGKDNLCTIHEFAPLSCRRYPYQINDKLNTRFCPLPSAIVFKIKGPDKPLNPLIAELEAHKKIVKKWNNKKGKKEEVLEFLINEANQTQFEKPAVGHFSKNSSLKEE